MTKLSKLSRSRTAMKALKLWQVSPPPNLLLTLVSPRKTMITLENVTELWNGKERHIVDNAALVLN